MIWVQELERDTRHDQQDGWTRPNVRICKTVLDFGLHAVVRSSVFRNFPYSGIRAPLNGATEQSELIRISLPKVNGNKRDKREITIDSLNFPWHYNDECDIIKCSLRQLSIASFLRSNSCSVPDIFIQPPPPPPLNPSHQCGALMLWKTATKKKKSWR